MNFLAFPGGFEVLIVQGGTPLCLWIQGPRSSKWYELWAGMEMSSCSCSSYSQIEVDVPKSEGCVALETWHLIEYSKILLQGIPTALSIDRRVF